MSQDKQEYSGEDLQKALDKLMQMSEAEVEALRPGLNEVRRDAEKKPGIAQYKLITSFGEIIPDLLKS
jgi:hypothetical protein